MAVKLMLSPRAVEKHINAIFAKLGLAGDPGAARYPPEVEAAVYFCCLEVLQNAAKYAGDAATAHIGMADRVAVIGGNLHIGALSRAPASPSPSSDDEDLGPETKPPDLGLYRGAGDGDRTRV
ncbi:MAG: hypothetical protein ACRDRI_16120 [Pseudonocardiaceae bacterium]